MLNEIIFRGFKSFADEQVMKFEKGINGIIGPNGCGKSNIIDGISFVLGAQSAKNLRGGKMQDVIFAGSGSRKEKDQAEVTLVLDNSDGSFKKAKGSQISVTRRVFRSGGSEYYIDKEPALLRDVHDLFMDTGVGSDSYSIIGQGQIGKILSTKLEERRAIFEEAAGIVKLKNQKEQTEKRLREVDGNMIRIEDIVKEIERQIKPLQKQAEKAVEFEKYSGELQSLEVQYLLHEYDDLERKISVTQTDAESLKNIIEQSQLKIDANEENLTFSKQEHQKKNVELYALQNETAALKEELERLNGSISLNNERVTNAHKAISDIEENLLEIEQKHSFSTDEFQKKKDRLIQISTDLTLKENKELELNDILTDHENKKMFLTNEIEHDRKKSVEEYNSVNQKTFEMEQIEKRKRELENEFTELTEKSSTTKSEMKRLKDSSLKIKSDYDALFEKLAKNELLQQEEAKKHKDLKLELSKAMVNVQETESEWFRQKNHIESIENFIENNGAFYDGVKAVLTEKKEGRIVGVHGAVAEILNVDKSFETAIESLLQSTMQFLVTDTDEVAKKCIQFLKKEKKGKATFLPLNLANANVFNEKEANKIKECHGIHLAIDVVKFDSLFEPIMKSLLGKSIIADNLDIALDFVKKNGIRAKISTLDGEIVQTGSISGGANKHQKANFFTKRRELEELKERHSATNTTLEAFKKQYEMLKEKIESHEIQMEEDNAILESGRADVNALQKEYEDTLHSIERFDEKTQEHMVNEKEATHLINESKTTIHRLKMAIDKSNDVYRELISRISTLEISLSEVNLEIETVKAIKTELFLEINRLSEESRQINSYLEDINNDNDSVEEKISKLYARKQNELGRIEEMVEHGSSLEKQQQSMKMELDKLTVNVTSMYESNQILSKEIDAREAVNKEDMSIQNQSEKELKQKEIYLSKRETERANAITRLKETYNFEEQDIQRLDRVEIDLTKSKKLISELKKQISSLGNINHAAVEEFEQLEERYKNEKEQLNDVKSAKADLNLLVTNVEAEMISRFMMTFDSIAEKFSKTFVELFEGGNARLTLENPSEPLTSAIDIIAQPPGKKPASINSLSGGEKSFTAVALIFAIISSKPSPFVILDEVDAPLDDANVARFAKQLVKYRSMSQFVVITHRKGTMMATDTLTGITQEEQGVSIVFPHTVEEKHKLLTKKTS